MAGLKMPETRPLDGKNIWPALRDRTASPVASYYWLWSNEDAIRTDQWKLHRFFDHVELYDIRTDLGETRNVADAHPETVKALAAQMDAWADSLDAALSHQRVPAKFDTSPAPDGEVLEVSVNVTGKPKTRDVLVVPFASWDGRVYATDYIEYDIAVAPGSPLNGFYYSPFKGNVSKNISPYFNRGEGIDQFGREQVSGPEPRGGAGMWEHRIIGLSSYGPGIMPGHAIVFRGARPGAYKVHLDNLRIRHADGSTTPIWMSGKDTKSKKIADTEFFQDIEVRTVSVSEVGKN
jgi:hypothetical protein